MRILVACFIEISPLNKELSRHALNYAWSLRSCYKDDGHTNRSKFYIVGIAIFDLFGPLTR